MPQRRAAARRTPALPDPCSPPLRLCLLPRGNAWRREKSPLRPGAEAAPAAAPRRFPSRVLATRREQNHPAARAGEVGISLVTGKGNGDARTGVFPHPVLLPDCARVPLRARRVPAVLGPFGRSGRRFLTASAFQVGSARRMSFSAPNDTLYASANYSDYSLFDYDAYEVPRGYRAILALYAVIFLVGVLGNGAVIWVAGFELRRTVNGVWFLNLSVADLLCCLALPFLALPLAHDHHWHLGRFACKLLPSLTILNMFASVLLLTAISGDRCALVTRPVWCQNHRTPGLARGVCAAAWGLALLLTIPSFVFRTTRSDEFSDKETCVLDYGRVGQHQRLTELFITVLRFLCGFLLPFVIITVCYGLLLSRVRGKGFARSQKAFKLVLVVIVSFFACWLPYHVVGLVLASTAPHSALFQRAAEADPVVAGVAYINSCVNPVIYVLAGQDFKAKLRRSWRAALRSVWCCAGGSTRSSRCPTRSTAAARTPTRSVRSRAGPLAPRPGGGAAPR
uniref:G-protein coupled receptors family 1 profile domain-containing protein n=1 Tax=Nothoprocta perdicaria TaxID=30464 RepID=A0A8C7EGY7_NOTPE